MALICLALASVSAQSASGDSKLPETLESNAPITQSFDYSLRVVPSSSGSIGQAAGPARPKPYPRYLDKTAIIRSLAPLEYLPGHSGRKRSVDLHIEFEFDSAVLPLRAHRQLDELAAALASPELRNACFTIAGHTDSSGAADYNKDLSIARAESVRHYLEDRYGLSPERFDVTGYGEERLKDPLAPDAAINRRVEVTLIGEQPPAATVAQPATGKADRRKKKIDW